MMKNPTLNPPDPAAEKEIVIVSVEESLVEDERSGLTPAQMVERKLVRLLKSNPLPVSQLNVGRRLIHSR
jgi:hypothetical protein